MGKIVEEAGNRYGRLLVLGERPFKKHGSAVYWKCECDCGGTIEARGTHLREGNIISCGCYSAARTHGWSKTRTYKSWKEMRRRCLNEKSDRYPYYGRIGVKICKRWDRFENFLEDLGERPANTSLDRIDSNGNYEPSNCRWASPEIQNNNKKNSTPKEKVDSVKYLRWLGLTYEDISSICNIHPCTVGKIIRRSTSSTPECNL
jgi:hypothetical protein